MSTTHPIPPGALPYSVILDPDFSGVQAHGGWEAWQQRIIGEMAEEGITITHIEGLSRFSGYYFANAAKPRRWLPHR